MAEDVGATDAATDQPEQQTQEEKMLRQSEVNSLVGRAKQDAAEKARREAEQKYQQDLERLQAQKQEAQSSGEDTKQLDADAIYQQIQEKFNKDMQQRQLEEQMNQVANRYYEQVNKGKEKYDDFGQVVERFNPASFPQIVYLVSNLENGSDVLYELAKDSQKLSTIDYLSKVDPQRAESDLRDLAQSISANEAAAQQEQQNKTPAPLDRLAPTNNTSSNGRVGVADLKRQPWLMG